jgi:tRNA threonylcarbamoyladenosine biosynthesis protein TsaB
LAGGRLLSSSSSAPLILALETATPLLSAAVLRGDELIEECRAAAGPAAETLLPCVDRLLSSTGFDLREVDAFAVSIGPGSFTSLRVGAATAKGLAFGTDRPIAAVSTLRALAERAAASVVTVVPMLDARRGEVYAAAYAGGAQREPILAEGVYTPEELCGKLNAPLLLLGDGIAVAGATLREQLGAVECLESPAGDPSAACVGALGARILAQGGGRRAEDLVPRYVRRAEAEVKRTGERFEIP